MKCTSCGKNIPNTAKICPFCRTKLVIEPEKKIEMTATPEPVAEPSSSDISSSEPKQTAEPEMLRPQPTESVTNIPPVDPQPTQTETPVITQPIQTETPAISSPEVSQTSVAAEPGVNESSETMTVTPTLSKKEQKRLEKEKKKLEKSNIKKGRVKKDTVITSESVNKTDAIDINSDSYYDDVKPDVMDTLPPSRYMLGIKIAGALIVAAGIVLTAIYYL